VTVLAMGQKQSQGHVLGSAPTAQKQSSFRSNSEHTSAQIASIETEAERQEREARAAKAEARLAGASRRKTADPASKQESFQKYAALGEKTREGIFTTVERGVIVKKGPDDDLQAVAVRDSRRTTAAPDVNSEDYTGSYVPPVTPKQPTFSNSPSTPISQQPSPTVAAESSGSASIATLNLESYDSAFKVFSTNSKEQCQITANLLRKIAQNIVDNPSEVKYRRIRINQTVIQEKIMNVKGAGQLLVAAGFEAVSMAPASDMLGISGAEEEPHLIFQLDQPLQFLRELLRRLENYY
jgi:outer membrane lipopolysaccharide assembly protein LptE/RlpB